MKANFDPSSKAHYTSNEGPNIVALKRDLKEKTLHLQSLFQTALKNPDQISQHLLSDISSSTLELHKLCEMAKSLPKSDVDSVRIVKESSELINNILNAPIYV